MLKDFLAIYIKSKAISKAIKTYPPAGLNYFLMYLEKKKNCLMHIQIRKEKNPFSMHRDEGDKVS